MAAVTSADVVAKKYLDKLRDGIGLGKDGKVYAKLKQFAGNEQGLSRFAKSELGAG